MTTFGTGTFGSGTFGDPSPGTTTPSGVGDGITLDAPTAVFAGAVAPDGDVADAVSSDGPTVSSNSTTTPDGIGEPAALDSPSTTEADAADVADGPAEPVTLDAPAVGLVFNADPDGIAEPATLDDPTLVLVLLRQPDGINDAVTNDAPSTTTLTTGTPTDGITVDAASDAPGVAFTTTTTPDGIGDATTGDAPTAAFTAAATTADGPAAPVALDDPDASYLTVPAGIADDVAFGDPATAQTITVGSTTVDVTVGDNPDAAYLTIPTGIGDALALDAPTALAVTTPTGIPVGVAAGDAPTTGYLTVPAGINDALSLGDPAPSQTVTVGSTTVDVTVGDGPTIRQLAAPYDGIVNKPVPGASIIVTWAPAVPYAAAPTDGIEAKPVLGADISVTFTLAPTSVINLLDGIICKPVLGVGIGVTFTPGPDRTAQPSDGIQVKPVPGAGIRVSYPDPVIPTSPHYDPIVPLYARTVAAPFHVLGIGPWNAGILWSGAANYGKGQAVYADSVPTLNMPDASSKAFTLRLNAGEEARADFDLPRDEAFIIQEMATDLWWRRRDPARSLVEPIGRFNAQNVDISSTDNTRVRVSATFVDYRSLLEDRLILTVANHPTAGLSAWEKGTPVTDILRFVVPVNAKLDLAEITPGTSTYIGTISEPIELPPGTTVGEAFTALRAISTKPWEWWTEMPTDNSSRPKLRLAPNGRGTNRGVYLIDTGAGESPITSWSVQAAGQKYANAIYFQGGTGGVVYTLPTDVEKYGQHDAQESDTTLLGNLPLIQAAAQKKVAELANQQITWTLNLREGFWEGRSHIDVGDPLTVQIRLGGELISGTHRVSEISGDIDSGGIETISLTLGAPLPARDPRSRYSTMARFVRSLKNYTRQST